MFTTVISKNKGMILILVLVSFFFIPSVFASQKTDQILKNNSQKEVLGQVSTVISPSPSPTPSPTPTLFPMPTQAPAVSLPTPTPSASPAPAVITSTPTPTSSPTSIPSPTPSLVPSPTASPSPTVGISVQIGIDYAGQRSADSYTVSVEPGKTAWDAIVAAVGINNLEYTDYGGDLGKFITGFNGVSAASNQFYDFKVNGASASVGVSSYNCAEGDKLDFVLTTF